MPNTFITPALASQLAFLAFHGPRSGTIPSQLNPHGIPGTRQLRRHRFAHHLWQLGGRGLDVGQHFDASDLRNGHHLFTPESIARVNATLNKIRPLAETKNATLGQLVLRWTLAQPGISGALVGARNPEQAVQNARAIDLNLTFEELDYINKQLVALQSATA